MSVSASERLPCLLLDHLVGAGEQGGGTFSSKALAVGEFYFLIEKRKRNRIQNWHFLADRSKGARLEAEGVLRRTRRLP